jgi:multidrug efflux system outer membrane protein
MRPPNRFLLSLPALAGALALAGCAAVGPDYTAPTLDTPSQFKETSTWKFARPADHLPRGTWWRVFGDATLNRLQQQAAADNPNLRAAMLRVEQARLVARGSTAQLLPSAAVAPYTERRGDSGNLRRSNVDNVDFGGTRNTFRLPLDASYEIDFWGRVRRSIEAARADADAAAALGATARLTMHADLAQTYYALRSVEAEMQTLRAAVELRTKAQRLVRDRFKAGAISELDSARADSELATAQSDIAALEQRRAELVNAISVLVGQPASTFSLTVSPLAGTPPAVPAGVPADLLQRRPDIAEAERKMAGASARIGVAKAAFFPSIRLTGRLALESSQASDIFAQGSKAWAAGAAVNFPIFEQAVNRTVYEGRKLQFEEALANYQSATLRAFQEVENSLSALRLLSDQAAAQQRAVEAAERAAQISSDRFNAGAVSYLEVVDADRTRLTSLRQSRQTAGQRYITTVQLIKALGGGW